MPLPVIPPLVLWALGALGAAMLAKLATREHRRINEELEKARSTPVRESERANLRTLRRDPRTGVYRAQD